MPEKITRDEIKALIKEEKVLPSDWFGVEALTGDPLVRGFVDSSLKELRGKLSGEYDGRKRVEKDVDKTRTELEEKDAELKKKDLEIAKIKSGGLFASKAKERKLDKLQNQFIEAKRGGFEPEDPESLDKEVDKFMDSTLEEYKKTAELFGHKTKPAEGEEEKKPGSEPGSEEEEEGDASHIPD